MDDANLLPGLLEKHREDLLRYVRRRAKTLLRFETAEDLVQSIHVRALERGTDFDFRGDRSFLSWLYTVAATYLADRRLHWSRQRRDAGRLLRITAHAASTADPRAISSPAASSDGPGTRAAVKEQVDLALEAMALLLPRDRQLVRWHAEGLDLAEQARRLGISYAAAQRAHHRALERFRKTFDLVS